MGRLAFHLEWLLPHFFLSPICDISTAGHNTGKQSPLQLQLGHSGTTACQRIVVCEIDETPGLVLALLLSHCDSAISAHHTPKLLEQLKYCATAGTSTAGSKKAATQDRGAVTHVYCCCQLIPRPVFLLPNEAAAGPPTPWFSPL
jgi:hypothetical protein